MMIMQYSSLAQIMEAMQDFLNTKMNSGEVGYLETIIIPIQLGLGILVLISKKNAISLWINQLVSKALVCQEEENQM